MSKILIVYGTKDGHTAKIAERIGEVVRQRGYQADVNNALQIRPTFSFEGYSGILVGASIQMGCYSCAARRFITRYKSQLETVPSAFFSVSITDASKTPEERSKLDSYIQGLFKKTGWHPDTVGRFAGAIPFTRYGFWKRFLMKNNVLLKGAADMSHDYEFTDWDQVVKFGNDFIDQYQAADLPS